MSTEENKSVLIRWFDALNKKDSSMLEKLADEFYTAESVLHDPGFPNMEAGPAGVKKFVGWILTNSPDMHMELHDMLADRDKVVSRFTVHNTDAATGKPVHTLVIAISRFVDGKIAEEWQLGVPGTW